MLRPIENRRRLTETVYELLREAIVTGELAPGARLVEEELSQRLQVSTTPVREAFHWLERDGLVSRAPFRGTYVRVIDADEVRAVYEVRIALETMAIRLACERIRPDEIQMLARIQEEGYQRIASRDFKEYASYNERFHDVILTASRNEMLRKLMAQVRHLVRWFATMTVQVPGQPERASQEHQLMIEALRDRDPGRAVTLMEQHLTRALQQLLEAYSLPGREAAMRQAGRDRRR